MKFIPISMSMLMMRSNMMGIKTETRRMRGLDAVNEKPDDTRFSVVYQGNGHTWIYDQNGDTIKCPYGNVGDTLYFRETWTQNGREYFRYKSDWPKGEGPFVGQGVPIKFRGKWKPSIHMPAIACRYWGFVKEISVERLNDVSRESAINEGVLSADGKFNLYGLEPIYAFVCDDPRDSYKSLWNMINGEGSYEKNPWVWVVKYEVIREAPEGWAEYLVSLQNKKKS